MLGALYSSHWIHTFQTGRPPHGIGLNTHDQLIKALPVSAAMAKARMVNAADASYPKDAVYLARRSGCAHEARRGRLAANFEHDRSDQLACCCNGQLSLHTVCPARAQLHLIAFTVDKDGSSA